MALPTRTETLDDLYTSTFNNRRDGVVDQIFDDATFYKILKSRGGIKFDGTGGRYLEVNLSYGTNETVTSLGRGDTISISDTKFLTVAQYEWKFVAGSIVRYYTDDAKNKSKSQHLNLANAKIDNLTKSLTIKFETFLFGDGTGNGSKDPEGLANLVDATPTDSTSIGNINQSTYSWWQNKTRTATGAASVYLLTDMRSLYNTCGKGMATENPNLIVTDQTSYELYEDEVMEQRQTVNKQAADAMVDTITFKGQPVIWSGQCTAGYMYMLNTEYIGMVIDPDINFASTEWKAIPNQLDRVMQIVVKMNVVATRRKSLGVLITIAA